MIYDVIISGAGPVGLFLACELAQAKCSVLILEKSEHADSPLKNMPFGVRGLSSPSIEAFDRRGLLQEFELHKTFKTPHQHQNNLQGARRQVGHFAGLPFHDGDVEASRWKNRLPGSPPTSLLSEMAEVEKILTKRALALKVEIRRGFAVTNIQQTENEVTVHSDNQTFKAKWLVGCDGARSIVRKLCDIEFAGTEPEFTGYSIKVEIKDAEKLKPGRNLTDKGMYMQSQPGYFAMVEFDKGISHGTENATTREHLQEVLRRVSNTDVTITAVQLATTWTDRARQAVQYRNKRIFLAGDAAHIHSPLGGQGLNLGLGDAMNLGWKLAAVIKDGAQENILDTYQEERHPIGAQVLDWSRAQVSIMRPDPAARAMNAIIRDLINTKDGATYMAERVWGIHTPSAPNFEFADGTALNDHMHEGRAILLDFTSNDSLEKIAREYSKQIKYVSTNAKEQLGFKALLIRPDGILAWSASDVIEVDALKHVIGKWLSERAE
jgi:2-polyprenyl-6-methoxyphenol hydroxylase-like FAD-dependent oxidoreductase